MTRNEALKIARQAVRVLPGSPFLREQDAEFKESPPIYGCGPSWIIPNASPTSAIVSVGRTTAIFVSVPDGGTQIRTYGE